MKILGISSYTYIGRNDGQEHNGYTLYVNVDNANVAGLSVRTINSSERVLNQALKVFNLKEYSELLNRDLTVYYNYNKNTKLCSAFAIVK